MLLCDGMHWYGIPALFHAAGKFCDSIICAYRLVFKSTACYHFHYLSLLSLSTPDSNTLFRKSFPPHTAGIQPIRLLWWSLNYFRNSYTFFWFYVLTRSTETVHTSAKARLTSVTIWIWIRIHDPYRHQNFVICSLVHCQPSLKIWCKSVWKFLCKVANKQANNDENINSLAEVITVFDYVW